MPIPDKTLERIKPCIIALLLTLMTVVGIMAQSSGDYGGGSTQPSPGLKFVGAGSTTVGVTGNVVTVSSSGGGGGSAAAALTNGFNFFTTSSYNIFNAPTLFVGSVTNNGEVYGGSFDSVNKFLLGSGGISNDWGNGLMYSSDGSLSFNYNGRTLNRQGGTTTFDYQNSNINDSSGVASGLFTTRVLRDSSNGTSLDWNGFKLEAAGQTEVDWNLLKLENNGTDKLDWKLNQVYGTWSNTGDFYVLGQIRGVAGAGNGFVTTTNLTVNGALMLNTNAYATTAYLNAANLVVLPAANGGTYAGIVVDTEGGTASQLLLQSTSANYMNIFNDASGGTIDVKKTTGNLSVQIGEAQKMSIGNTLSTYGDSSSFAHTFNGQTFTFAHLASLNTDVLRIGPAGSTLTNATSFVTTGTYNGVTPGNMLTNLASSADSAITWSAQGTRIMTPSLAGFVATNGSTANAGNYTNYSGANLRSTTTYTTGLVYTVAASDWCVGSIDTGQTVRIMLPTSGHTGRTLRIFKTNESGFSTIIDAGAGNNINGSTNLLLNLKYAPVDLIYTGTEWIAK